VHNTYSATTGGTSLRPLPIQFTRIRSTALDNARAGKPVSKLKGVIHLVDPQGCLHVGVRQGDAVALKQRLSLMGLPRVDQ